MTTDAVAGFISGFVYLTGFSYLSYFTLDQSVVTVDACLMRSNTPARLLVSLWSYEHWKGYLK